MTKTPFRSHPQVAVAQAKVQDMFGQSLAVLTQPSVATFERFERRGGVQQAALFVMVAAVVSALVAALFAPFHSDVTVLGQLISRLVLIPVQFFILLAISSLRVRELLMK